MQESERHFIVATAGHVDHGKSALVKALTGTDPDRLPEEKARGMTIDLGYADLLLSSPGSAPRIRAGFVDVPGHKDFIKNMIAGVTACDAALVVIAANEGWMPQTEEHLQILEHLGVERAIVVLSKADLVDAKAVQSITQTVRERLRGSAFGAAPILAASSVRPDGVSAVRNGMAELFGGLAPARDIGKPRLYVDRAFSLRGTGTVVTGTLRDGTLVTGQDIEVLPSGMTARIRGIQSYHTAVEKAVPGSRVALNLPALSVQAPGREGIRRGHLVTAPGCCVGSLCWDVCLFRTSRRDYGRKTPGNTIENGALLRVHHGTSNILARCVMHGRGHLGLAERCIAQLRFESALAGFVGDRFVLRDAAGTSTLAGGIVLDPVAARKSFHAPARQESLGIQAQFPKSAEAVIAAILKRQPMLERAGLLSYSLFSAAEVEKALSGLQSSGQLRFTASHVVASSEWLRCKRAALRVIDDFHAQHPEADGLTREAFNAQLRGDVPSQVFPELLDELVGEGHCAPGAVVARRSFSAALSGEHQPAAERIRRLLAEAGLNPPGRGELVPDPTAKATLDFLLRRGEAVQLSADVFLGVSSYALARSVVINFLAAHSSATVSELRQVLGTTRRVAVPLLEKLDAEGITRREGDRRVLAQEKVKDAIRKQVTTP